MRPRGATRRVDRRQHRRHPGILVLAGRIRGSRAGSRCSPPSARPRPRRPGSLVDDAAHGGVDRALEHHRQPRAVQAAVAAPRPSATAGRSRCRARSAASRPGRGRRCSTRRPAASISVAEAPRARVTKRTAWPSAASARVSARPAAPPPTSRTLTPLPAGGARLRDLRAVLVHADLRQALRAAAAFLTSSIWTTSSSARCSSRRLMVSARSEPTVARIPSSVSSGAPPAPAARVGRLEHLVEVVDLVLDLELGRARRAPVERLRRPSAGEAGRAAPRRRARPPTMPSMITAKGSTGRESTRAPRPWTSALPTWQLRHERTAGHRRRRRRNDGIGDRAARGPERRADAAVRPGRRRGGARRSSARAAGIAKLVAKGGCWGRRGRSARRLEVAGALEDLRRCELIIEAAPERLELKHELFAALSRDRARRRARVQHLVDPDHRDRARRRRPVARRRAALLQPARR